MVVGALAETPQFAGTFAFEDLAYLTSQYPLGPNPSCCTADLGVLVAAAVHYVGLVDAIRALAETTLNLELNDPSDYELASVLAAVFLACYFTDYVDHINLWRDAHGEDPFELNVGFLSQITGFFETLFGKIGNFFTKSKSSSAPDEELAKLNPLTYRGYLYDPDVDMYYLKSRFYNPQVGRFLNADSIFDTKTGMLGTNMFAYCENNPVNRVDTSGLWSANVHYGRNVITGVASKYNEIQYGTFIWAQQIGFSSKKAEEIAFGNSYVEDIFLRLPETFANGDILGLSWHGNKNLFKPMGMILPETTELRSLETLISLSKEIYYLNDFCVTNWFTTEFLNKDLFLATLGIATHPVQDKHGHPEYWALDLSLSSLFVSIITFIFLNGFSEGNEVDNTCVIHGVRYYQFDNVIRSREETYNILGRWINHKNSPV